MKKYFKRKPIKIEKQLVRNETGPFLSDPYDFSSAFSTI